MNPAVVSIVIPCFRQGHYLAGAIDAALNQSHPAVEVVVVNDGSDDQTDEVARGYGSRITYVSQANQGLSAARNSGIAVATGKYLLVLDSDDLLHPDAVRWLVETADNRENVLCVMGFRNFTDENVRTPECAGKPPGLSWPEANPRHSYLPTRFLTENGDLRPALFRSNLGPPHSYLSSRSMIQRCGGFDTRLKSCEDWDAWVRLVFAGAELVIVERYGAYYRQHPHSMSRNFLRMAQTRVEVMSRIRQRARTDPQLIRRLGDDPARLRRQLRDFIAQEYFEAGYHLREQGDYLSALRQFALSVWKGRPKAEAIGGACKLLPHRLLRALSPRR
jgi:GT2 family glycosyltransferase